MNVSKSKYCNYVSCPKKCWLSVHKPELAEIDADKQRRFDEGNEVGALAKGLFGEFIDVTTRAEDGSLDIAAMIKKTESVLLEALQTLMPREEIVLRLRFIEDKTVSEVAKEFNVTRDMIEEVESTALRRLRNSERMYKINRQLIFVGQNELSDPVPTEEQKEFILRLAKENGISKERANRGFIHTCIRANRNSVLAEADYDVISELIKYLKEAL